MTTRETKQPVAVAGCARCQRSMRTRHAVKWEGDGGKVENRLVCGRCFDALFGRRAAAADSRLRSPAEKTAFDSSAWLGISARTKAAIQKAAAGWGLEVLKAEWTRVRKGGIMCGPEGGWMVVVRACRGKHREVALGYTLAELYDDMQESGRKVRYMDNAPRAGMPSAKLCREAGQKDA